MPSVNYAEVKKMVTLRILLDRYGVTVRYTNPHTQQFKGKCPFPSHAASTGDSLEVNFEKNAFHCWSSSCGAKGSALDFVMLMEGCNAYTAALKIVQWYGTKKESLPPETEGPLNPKSKQGEATKATPRLQVVSSTKKEDTSLIDWLENPPADNVSDEGGGTGAQPVPSDSSAQARPGQKGFMKSIDAWLDDLVVRKNESEAEFWHRVRNGIKKKLIENYRELRKEVARTA